MNGIVGVVNQSFCGDWSAWYKNWIWVVYFYDKFAFID